MDIQTVEEVYTLSEQIALKLGEIITALSRLPPAVQDAFAVTCAGILLDFEVEPLSERFRAPNIPDCLPDKISPSYTNRPRKVFGT